jgi:hypothetical protein
MFPLIQLQRILRAVHISESPGSVQCPRDRPFLVSYQNNNPVRPVVWDEAVLPQQLNQVKEGVGHMARWQGWRLTHLQCTKLEPFVVGSLLAFCATSPIEILCDVVVARGTVLFHPTHTHPEILLQHVAIKAGPRAKGLILGDGAPLGRTSTVARNVGGKLLKMGPPRLRDLRQSHHQVAAGIHDGLDASGCGFAIPFGSVTHPLPELPWIM